ncbi:hypothetical protein FE257_005580 [Aspergillus nanangensis]|uniref:Required for respiratory growth protein 7, mitochondrial n=1 Tax=Aspergillus nanangensis TaxID=2582783 RepID=A0AAD4GUK0_ASPNN|nr:hypothetical protein FE257_005580 [Aspergillus nanangensis]
MNRLRLVHPSNYCQFHYYYTRHNHPRNLSTFTRRLFKLPSPPTLSVNHHDLPTFLTHASRTSLPQTTTTYIGTHYEYIVQQTLRRSAFLLSRTGGRLDAGIDLLGTWHLPQHEHPVRTIVQCKSLKAKAGPNIVRELEGTFHQAPVGWRTRNNSHTLGVLVSPRETTKGVRDALARSSYPLMWMMVTRDGTVRQALWNARAEEMGLGGLQVEVRFDIGDGGGHGGGDGKHVVLTWDGEEMPHMDVVERQMERVERDWLELFPGIEPGVVLETVEELFPGEKPWLYRRGCCGLSDEERDKVVERCRHTS